MEQIDDLRHGYEKAKADALAAIPTNWLDSLLTGPKAVLSGDAGRWGCPDIEKLMTAICERIKAIQPAAANNGSPMTKPQSTESLLRAALENIKDMLGETLNDDFGFWSSPTNNARRAFVWGSYKAAEAALAVAPQEQDGIVWREGASAPEDGTEIIVGVTYRYALYKPDGRRQKRASGRWQCMGDYGWENCAKPERWISAAPSEALSRVDGK